MDEMTRKTQDNRAEQGNTMSVNRTQATQVQGRRAPVRRRTPMQSRQSFANNVPRPQSGQKRSPQNRRGQKNDPHSEKTITLLDKVVSVCIFMLFFGLPLFFLNMTYQGISFEKQYYFYFWIFIGVIAWSARGVLGGKIEIRRTTLDIPLGVLWLVYVLATVFSVDKYHSFFGFFGNPITGLISITSIILAYYLIVSFVSKDRVMVLWWAIVASGSVVTIWSFLATMRFIPEKVLQYIVPSLTGSFTSLAAFLAMMLPLFIISVTLLDQSNGNKLKQKGIIGFLFIITIINLITLSNLFGYVRWYVVIAAVALLLVFAISGFVEVSQKTSILAILTFFILIGFLIFGQPIFLRTAIQPEASLNYGLSFNIAKEAIKNKLILGSGPGTYGYNFSLYRPKDLNQSGRYDIRFFSDRGILLESLSTIGIMGAIALVVMSLTYISTVVHAFMRSDDEVTKTISLGLFVTSIMALLYALLWAVDGIIILYGVLIAAVTLGLLREGATDGGDNKLTLSMSSTPQNALSFAFLSILVAVGVIFGFVTLGKMFVADVHAGSALKARAINNFDESSTKFERAVRLNDQEGRYFTIISQYGLDLANVELAKGEDANKDAVASFINSATGAAVAGRNLMPNDVLANETAGFIFENSGGYVNGALSSAISSYERARELEPQNPYLDIAVGKLKLMEAQTKGEDAVEEKNALIEDAKKLFESARDKTMFKFESQEISTFAPAYYYIAITEEALGNIDESITAMTTALRITQLNRQLTQQQILSRQINYGFNLARLLQVRGTDEDNKNAESLLLQIIGVNDQEINSYLNLGLLYERTGRGEEATSEYKKILTILPEDDEKARENIQGLIDTIEQGGSNVDVDKKQEVSDGINDEEAQEVTVEEPAEKKISLLVVSGKDSEDNAQKGLALFDKEDYELTESVRNEDRDIEGVTIMYGGDIDQNEISDVKKILSKEFEDVQAERNDEEVSKYNHDIVVTIGSPQNKEEKNKEDN